MKIPLLAFLLGLAYVNMQAAKADTSLYLIPRPKKIEIKNGAYNFSRPFTIITAHADKFCAQQLQGAIANKFNTRPVNEAAASNKITLVKADSADFDNILKAEKIKPSFDLGSEGYIISITPKAIFLIAHQDAGVFYGVQTLIQLINANPANNSIPCALIYDKPDMQMRGWQDDISRGPIPTMNFLKEEIRRMSSFKLNTFTLYTEHVFKLTKHPEIAPADGITEEQIKQLVLYAKDYHVEIIGNFQSFGHFGHILQVPAYSKLAENQSTLSPAKQESYQFLGDAYSEVAPAYDSKYFHINCDEVDLGGGPCQGMIDTMGLDGVYAYHVNRIDSLLKPYHKRIMMWGDIAVKNPKIISRLPKDMIIVSWNYGAMESMDEEIMPFVKSGFQFIVAPGVSCWNRIYPDMNRAIINIYNYLRDGYKNRALGFINTTWDDDGQNLFNNNWYGLVWGADCSWNTPANEPPAKSAETRKKRNAVFNRAYNKIYFNTETDVVSLLFGLANLNYGPVKNSLSDWAIWDPILPDYQIIPENYEQANLDLVKSIDSLNNELNKCKVYFAGKQAEFDCLAFALRQARLVANKNVLGIKLKNYISDGSIKGSSYFTKDFTDLNDTIKALKPAYGKLWATESRNWWRDTVLSYYDSFAGNLEKLKGVCIIGASDTLVHGKREITLRSTYGDLPVYYTLDGSTPDANSIRYMHPVYVDTNISILARVIDKGAMYHVQHDSLIFHMGIGKLYKLNSKWDANNTAHAARGKYGLLDGRRGSRDDFNDGRWQAYLGSDIDLELDFGHAVTLSKITMGFAQLVRDGILFPKEIEISTSTDGKKYALCKTLKNTIDPKIEARMTHDFAIELNSLQARYIKIVAKSIGPLPEWHYAKGRPSWLFADEIIVE